MVPQIQPSVRRTVPFRPPIILVCSFLFLLLHTDDLMAQGFLSVGQQHSLTSMNASDNYGSGVSFYDLDNDGWDDLTFAQTNDSLLIYRNVNGNLVKLPSTIFTPGQTRHVLWADYDNDGDMDLVVTTYNGICRLYNNDGELGFTDVTQEAGLLMFNTKTYGASFGDYDNDGNLDLYVCTYEHEGDESSYEKLNHLYHNNGNGTFTDVTLTAGVGDGIKFSFQALWFDINMDGFQDLFVINDRSFSNSMYLNNGDGTFTDITEGSGMALPLQDPMSLTVGDMDNDGDLDIFITNTGISGKNSKLLVNNGDATFTEDAVAHGVDLYSWCWGATWVDITNNSDLDLYVTSAVPFAQSDPNFLMGNLGDGEFVNATTLIGGSNNALSFSPVTGDLNNDGFADIAVQNKAPYPPYLYLNQGGTNNYVKLTPQGTISNRQAVGTWIHVYFDGEHRVKYTLCGENYLGQISQHLIFGLGTAEVVDSIQVTYLSGHTDTYYDLAVNTSYTLTEGETYIAQIALNGLPVLCPDSDMTLDAGDHSTWLWNTGHTGRYITVTEPGDYSVIVTNSIGITATDTVTIGYAETPVIEVAASGPLCHGDNTGSITLSADAPIDLTQVLWNIPEVGPEIAGLSAGIYTYTYIDPFGCPFVAPVELTSPPELVITATSTPATSGNFDGTIEFQVIGGTPPVEVIMDEVAVISPIEELFTGTYILAVTDNNGCSGTTTIVVDLSTRVNALQHAGSSTILPNPFDTWFRVSGDALLESMVITDMDGRLVMRINRPMESLIDGSLLVPGAYTVTMRSRDGHVQHQRIIKMP